MRTHNAGFGAGDRNSAQRLSSGRAVRYYMAWFFRLFHATDHGWQQYRTADGKAIMCQDAYFTRALEMIAVTLNLMIEEQRNK